jgi:hypothetical protein
MAPKTMDPALLRWSPLLSLCSSIIGACFWLVVVCKFNRRPPKVTVYFLFDIFFASNLLPPTIGRCPPTHSNPRAPPLQHPFYRGRQLLVDCCVLPINGGHLRLMHHFPLYFLMWFILVSQMGTNQHGER